MKKSLFIIVLSVLTVLFAYTAFATDPVTYVHLLYPANNSMLNTNDVYYTFNISGNASSYDCTLYTNVNTSATSAGYGARADKGTIGVLNNTTNSFQTDYDLDETSNALYKWSVKCVKDGVDANGAWATGANNSVAVAAMPTQNNATFGVDVTVPSVTYNELTPTSGQWRNSNLTPIGMTVIDSNPDFCYLNTTLKNYTFNVTWGGWRIATNLTYRNDTEFNFTGYNGTASPGLYDSATGTFSWGYACNDTAGNKVYVGASDQVFFIDTLKPDPFAFNFTKFSTDYAGNTLSPNSTATDYTPQIGWNLSNEMNFSYWEINFWDKPTLLAANLVLQQNVTGNTTTATNTSSLSPQSNNISYYIQVTAVDMAGNKRNMSVGGTANTYVNYTPTTRCHTLYAGWNVCPNLGNNKSLSAWLNDSGASTTAVLNESNEFWTHPTGGSWGQIYVTATEPVFLYMDAAATYSNRIENLTSVETVPVGKNRISYILNKTASDWNIVVMMNHTYTTFDFQKFDLVVNGNTTLVDIGPAINVTYMSLFNNSASNGSKYIPYVGNLTYNNATKIQYGDVIWVFAGRTTMAALTINWTNISR